ncbi:MAG: CocE/NonD family hydrolase, partial [Nocardioidaceae bacterium]
MADRTEVRIPLSDGAFLAATLYLPDPAGGPQPCLVEALPYRKDDLTSSYADSYERFRDEFGYAVARIDVRGTGSSSGDPLDEYQEAEQRDLVEAIEWLAGQQWCDGSIGMWGTSYSGFNSLQIACEAPPQLKAVICIYGSDDRWTDDVHWRGGALRLVDLVDYCHYMTPMPMLPPVPALWPEDERGDWRDEWRHRLDTTEPWVLTWLRENRDGPYWRHGSVRLPAPASLEPPSPAVERPSPPVELVETKGYDRIRCPVMLVAGWADGYRNNSFRTVEALGKLGVPVRLLAGPWVHADPTTAYPGPRIDLDYEMAAWWDTWLRGGLDTPSASASAYSTSHPDTTGDRATAHNSDTTGDRVGREERATVSRSRVDLFVRTATRPAAFLDQHEGYWVSDIWPSPSTRWESRSLTGPRTLPVRADTGTSAWIDCAGHLPWGLSTDQREDDAHSLTWDWPAAGEVVIGQPRLRIRVSADQPLASLSVKLDDVFPDGASALVTRGSLDLTYRDGVHAPSQPSPLTPGEAYDVVLDLDACAYRFGPGQRLRIAIAGTDWPNTIAPPYPVNLTVHEASLELPLWDGPGVDPPSFTPGADTASEDPDGVRWDITRDVLRETTTCSVSYGGDPYDTPFGGTAHESYAGKVVVDNITFEQYAEAECTFRLTWPGIDVEVSSTMRVDVTEAGYDVVIEVRATDGGTE